MGMGGGGGDENMICALAEKSPTNSKPKYPRTLLCAMYPRRCGNVLPKTQVDVTMSGIYVDGRRILI